MQEVDFDPKPAQSLVAPAVLPEHVAPEFATPIYTPVTPPRRLNSTNRLATAWLAEKACLVEVLDLDVESFLARSSMPLALRP